ncbi:uncharacterized protein LOC126325913 [Schistocerca gregaria]|uniref:uncharacterized protein LOC126325913 n=1 Tax=Schistocerca gregaria TaxID=7010 RepID=UPI00211E4DFB|nr:uncharacterized protein LOC126325913 [Schistocerca gregaria]
MSSESGRDAVPSEPAALEARSEQRGPGGDDAPMGSSVGRSSSAGATAAFRKRPRRKPVQLPTVRSKDRAQTPSLAGGGRSLERGGSAEGIKFADEGAGLKVAKTEEREFPLVSDRRPSEDIGAPDLEDFGHGFFFEDEDSSEGDWSSSSDSEPSEGLADAGQTDELDALGSRGKDDQAEPVEKNSASRTGLRDFLHICRFVFGESKWKSDWRLSKCVRDKPKSANIKSMWYTDLSQFSLRMKHRRAFWPVPMDESRLERFSKRDASFIAQVRHLHRDLLIFHPDDPLSCLEEERSPVRSLLPPIGILDDSVCEGAREGSFIESLAQVCRESEEGGGCGAGSDLPSEDDRFKELYRLNQKLFNSFYPYPVLSAASVDYAIPDPLVGSREDVNTYNAITCALYSETERTWTKLLVYATRHRDRFLCDADSTNGDTSEESSVSESSSSPSDASETERDLVRRDREDSDRSDDQGVPGALDSPAADAGSVREEESSSAEETSSREAREDASDERASFFDSDTSDDAAAEYNDPQTKDIYSHWAVVIDSDQQSPTTPDVPPPLVVDAATQSVLVSQVYEWMTILIDRLLDYAEEPESGARQKNACPRPYKLVLDVLNELDAPPEVTSMLALKLDAIYEDPAFQKLWPFATNRSKPQ